jgi:hypothetical protein
LRLELLIPPETFVLFAQASISGFYFNKHLNSTNQTMGADRDLLGTSIRIRVCCFCALTLTALQGTPMMELGDEKMIDGIVATIGLGTKFFGSRLTDGTVRMAGVLKSHGATETAWLFHC